MEFYHHLPSWAMNEQMSYFSSFSDEWSRDLKSVQVQKQRSCRGGANDFESVNQLIVADKMFEMLDSETATCCVDCAPGRSTYIALRILKGILLHVGMKWETLGTDEEVTAEMDKGNHGG
ncbi:hypothetical protein TNCV_4517841 [Trichonephila clavipes]|nr:hypothetical protein TNCV_4517841 [Trichonephila clavipes]